MECRCFFLPGATTLIGAIGWTPLLASIFVSLSQIHVEEAKNRAFLSGPFPYTVYTSKLFCCRLTANDESVHELHNGGGERPKSVDDRLLPRPRPLICYSRPGRKFAKRKEEDVEVESLESGKIWVLGEKVALETRVSQVLHFVLAEE